MVNFLPTIRLAQYKLNINPSKNKHLKKGPLKNISPAAYFQNFTAFGDLLFFSVEATIESFQKIQHKLNLCVFFAGSSSGL